MKRFFFLFILLLSITFLPIQATHLSSGIIIHWEDITTFQYKFKITGIITHGDTKPVMDVVAGILGKRPIFNEETRYFQITSDVDILEDVFSERMAKSGYTITDFYRDLDNSQSK